MRIGSTRGSFFFDPLVQRANPVRSTYTSVKLVMAARFQSVLETALAEKDAESVSNACKSKSISIFLKKNYNT